MSLDLAPAEAFVLLDPKRSSPIEAFKIAFLSLVAAGVVKVTMVERRGLLWTRKVPVISVERPAEGPFLGAKVVHVIQQAQPTASGIAMKGVAQSALQAFGPGLVKFKTEHILASLIRQGLVTADPGRVLGLFPTIKYAHTPEGLVEKARIEAELERARRLPMLLASDPAEAKALALAAGGLLLLLPELRAQYGQLAQLKGLVTVDDDSDLSFDVDAFDLGFLDFDFDFGSFDTSFDSSFDIGGDSGGDGGGDSGGHSSGDSGGGDGGGH